MRPEIFEDFFTLYIELGVSKVKADQIILQGDRNNICCLQNRKLFRILLVESVDDTPPSINKTLRFRKLSFSYGHYGQLVVCSEAFNDILQVGFLSIPVVVNHLPCPRIGFSLRVLKEPRLRRP